MISTALSIGAFRDPIPSHPLIAFEHLSLYIQKHPIQISTEIHLSHPIPHIAARCYIRIWRVITVLPTQGNYFHMWDPVLVCWSSHGVKGVHSVHEGRKSESRPKHVNWIKLHNSFPRRLVTWSAGWFKLWQAEEVWSGLVDPKIASCQIFCGGLVPANALQCFCFSCQNVFSMDLENAFETFQV